MSWSTVPRIVWLCSSVVHLPRRSQDEGVIALCGGVTDREPLWVPPLKAERVCESLGLGVRTCLGCGVDRLIRMRFRCSHRTEERYSLYDLT